MAVSINKANVGRIAERIAAIELEARGFHVTDLNKDGIKANADLLAAKHGRALQLQVKGSTWNESDPGWWFNYGFCKDEHIQDRSLAIFNRVDSFYRAEFVVLICVKSPTEYTCVVLPISEAESAAQLNLELFRMKKTDGGAKKPGKMWCSLDYIPKSKDPERKRILREEQQIIQKRQSDWKILEV